MTEVVSLFTADLNMPLILSIAGLMGGLGLLWACRYRQPPPGPALPREPLVVAGQTPSRAHLYELTQSRAPILQHTGVVDEEQPSVSPAVSSSPAVPEPLRSKSYEPTKQSSVRCEPAKQSSSWFRMPQQVREHIVDFVVGDGVVPCTSLVGALMTYIHEAHTLQAFADELFKSTNIIEDFSRRKVNAVYQESGFKEPRPMAEGQERPCSCVNDPDEGPSSCVHWPKPTASESLGPLVRHLEKLRRLRLGSTVPRNVMCTCLENNEASSIRHRDQLDRKIVQMTMQPTFVRDQREPFLSIIVPWHRFFKGNDGPLVSINLGLHITPRIKCYRKDWWASLRPPRSGEVWSCPRNISDAASIDYTEEGLGRWSIVCTNSFELLGQLLNVFENFPTRATRKTSKMNCLPKEFFEDFEIKLKVSRSEKSLYQFSAFAYRPRTGFRLPLDLLVHTARTLLIQDLKNYYRYRAGADSVNPVPRWRFIGGPTFAQQVFTLDPTLRIQAEDLFNSLNELEVVASKLIFSVESDGLGSCFAEGALARLHEGDFTGTPGENYDVLTNRWLAVNAPKALQMHVY